MTEDHQKNLQILRRRAKQSRREAAAQAPDAPQTAADRFLAQFAPTPFDIVAVYWPFGGELNTQPLMDRLRASGVGLALPRVDALASPLKFHMLTHDAALSKDLAGMQAPPPDAPLVRPTLIVAPLLAFTRAGDRLGYGGGYYDRTLAHLRASAEPAPLCVGYAFADQEVAGLPVGPHDQKLDAVSTERDVFSISR